MDLNEKITTPEQNASWVEEMKTRERLRNRQIWVDWLNTLAAFHGRPDLKFGSDYRQLERLTPAQRAELEEVAVNWVQPHVRTFAAHLLKARPVVEGVPETTDESDIQAAKVADRLLRGEWSRQDMDTRRVEAMMWVGATGNAFWHTFFDRDGGPVMPLDDGQSIPIGQTETETLNPFKVVTEPHRGSIDKCRWAIISQRLPTDETEAKYAPFYEQIHREPLRLRKSSSGVGTKRQADLVIDTYLSAIGFDRAYGSDDSDFVDVDTFYHIPTSRYPDGLYSIVSCGKTLYFGKYPYPFLRILPICHFREILSPWRFLGETGATHVLRAQEYYVSLRQMERRFMRNFALGKWLLPRGCRIRKEHLTNPLEAFVAYDSRGGEKPEFLPGSNPPSSIVNAMATARDDGNRASGLNEASQGIVPQGVTAGRAILALQEMDSTRLGLTVQQNETEYARWGRINLLMAREFYEEPRKYAISGDSLVGAVQYFNRADLRDTTDVRCVPGSALPQNKASKQQSVLELFGSGIFGPQQDPETLARVRKILEFGQTEDYHDESALDDQHAEQENQALVMMAKQYPQGLPPEAIGQVAPVALWDNHILHVKSHLRAWKIAIIKGNSAAASLIAPHLQLHAMITNPPPQPEQPQQPPISGPPAQVNQSVATASPQGGEPVDQQLTPQDMPPRGE